VHHLWFLIQVRTSSAPTDAMTQSRLDRWFLSQRNDTSLVPQIAINSQESEPAYQQFNFLHCNACSLTSEKAQLLKAIAAEQECSAICIAELGHRRALPGWKCISSTDTFTQSGIFIRHGVQAKKIELPDLPSNNRIAWQAIAIESLNEHPTMLIHVYIPPDTQVPIRKLFWRMVNDFVRPLHNQNIFLAGDLNTRSACFDPTEVPSMNSFMEDILDELPWNVISDGTPTRFDNCLDVTLANDNGTNQTICWLPLHEVISDHLPCLTKTSIKIAFNLKGEQSQPFQIIDMNLTTQKIERWINHRHDRPGPVSLDAVCQQITESITRRTLWHPVQDFWNEDLNKLRRLRNRAFRLRKTCKQHDPVPETQQEVSETVHSNKESPPKDSR
jgi:hypothetical protein